MIGIIKALILIISIQFTQLSIYSKSSSPIEIILSSDNSIYEQALYGIQSSLETDYKISYYDIIISENSSIESYFQNLESSGVPLVIAIGPQAAKVAKDNLNKTPVIFSMISNPKSLGLNQKNFCGVGMDISISEFFQTLNQIDPRIRKVYAFYSSDEINYQAGEGNFRDIEYNLLYSAMNVSDKNFESTLNELNSDADAFYMISDPIYNSSRFEMLSEFAKKNNIILMTTFPVLVKAGATFAISPEYSKLGVETGSMANRVLSGKSNCSKERVLLPTQSAFYINEEYANASGINIPDQILERAKQTKLFSAGITLLNENKLTSARTIFEAILKKDSNNTSAQTYLALTIEKITGTKTKELLKLANSLYANNQFLQAKKEYSKILQINPNNELAKFGLKETTIALSEQERLRGNAYEKSDKNFEAIKEYLSSLRTLPSNTKTQFELANLRKSESTKIETYLKQGINYYNERQYDISIQMFENILLINPEEKSAKEYLRLSYKKKEAIEILKEKLRNKN